MTTASLLILVLAALVLLALFALRTLLLTGPLAALGLILAARLVLLARLVLVLIGHAEVPLLGEPSPDRTLAAFLHRSDQYFLPRAWNQRGLRRTVP